MNFRADQLLMLGVVGLGAYALYRMTQATPGQTPANAGPMGPTPQAPSAPTGSNLPERPGLPGPFGQEFPRVPVIALPNAVPTIHLTNSRAYQGRIETISSAGRAQSMPFSPIAEAEVIASGLRGLGFDAVQVFMTPEEAARPAPDGEPIFSAATRANAGRGTRWFYGRYTGETRDAAAPEGLALLYIVRGLGRPDSAMMQVAGYGGHRFGRYAYRF